MRFTISPPVLSLQYSEYLARPVPFHLLVELREPRSFYSHPVHPCYNCELRNPLRHNLVSARTSTKHPKLRHPLRFPPRALLASAIPKPCFVESEGRAEERASQGNAKSSFVSKTQARAQAVIPLFPLSSPPTSLDIFHIATLPDCRLATQVR